MKNKKEIVKELEELEVKVKTCFKPKTPVGSVKYAEGFMDALRWVLNIKY